MIAEIPPVSAGSLLTQWVFDPVAVALSVAAGVAYAGGVRRLAARGRAWRRARTAAFAAGIATLLLATSSGIAAYDTTLFSVHVAQHVLLGIVGPLLFALGAPVTLLVQAASRPTQRNVIRVLHSRPVAILGHPLTAWLLFGLSLFALYFSPLYELSLRNDVVHAWVHLHFVVVGSLFFWAVIGIDPSGRRLPHAARLLLVLLTVPFHAFLGLALMSTTTPIAADWYASLATGWAGSPLDDQRAGAALMGLAGDLVGLVAAFIIALDWFHADQRRARRIDRQLDLADATRAQDRPRQ